MAEPHALEHAPRSGAEAGEVTRECLDGDYQWHPVAVQDDETNLPPLAEPSVGRERHAADPALRQAVAMAGLPGREYRVDLTGRKPGTGVRDGWLASRSGCLISQAVKSRGTGMVLAGPSPVLSGS
jgi:hypothetical protein